MISEHSHKFIMNWTHPLRFCWKLSEGGHFGEDFPSPKLEGFSIVNLPMALGWGRLIIQNVPLTPFIVAYDLFWVIPSAKTTTVDVHFESLVTNRIWKRNQYVIYKMDDLIQLKHLDVKIWKRCCSSLVLLCLLHHDNYPNFPLFRHDTRKFS